MVSATVAHFKEEFDRLQAQALARLAETHAAQVEQLLEQLQGLRQDAISELDQIAKKQKTHGELPPIPEAGSCSVQDSLGTALRDEAVAVCVSGEKLFIHRHVLRTIPFFGALLDGEWNDAHAPEVNLPCSADEFSLLVRCMYTGEPIGGRSSPLPTCASALRIAAAAAILLIEDRVPQLPELLWASIMTKEDALLAVKALGVLPASLTTMIRNIQVSPTLTPDVLRGLLNSKSVEARKAADGILCAHKGCVDAPTLANALPQALQSSYRDGGRMKWLLHVAEEHLTEAQTISVYQSCTHKYGAFIICWDGCRQHSNNVEPEGAVFLRAGFLAYLLRCVRRGVDLKQFDRLIRLRTDSPLSCKDNPAGMPVLLLGPKDSAALAQLMHATDPEHRELIADEIARAPASALVKFLSWELVEALGVHLEHVIAKLAASPADALAWTTEEKLRALPLLAARLLCGGLVSMLDRMSPPMSTIVAEALV